MTATEALSIALRAVTRASEALARETAARVAAGDVTMERERNPKYCDRCHSRGRCVDSRVDTDGAWRRRYRCPQCDVRWSSRETVHTYD